MHLNMTDPVLVTLENIVHLHLNTITFEMPEIFLLVYPNIFDQEICSRHIYW